MEPELTSTDLISTVLIKEEHAVATPIHSVVVVALRLLVQASKEAPDKSAELVLQGTFHPTAQILLKWPVDVQSALVVRSEGRCSISAKALPDDSQSVVIQGRVSLQDIHFSGSRGWAVMVNGHMKDIVGPYEIKGCEFEECGGGGIKVWISDSELVLKKGAGVRSRIVGNQIRGFNRCESKWKYDGISVFDQGCLIAGNYVCDSPTEVMGIRAMGRDLVVEHNYIEGVSVNDAGGIYFGAGNTNAPPFRGRIARWNFVVGASCGIYVDDGSSGTRVTENIVVQSSRAAIWLSGGRDNIVERNILDNQKNASDKEVKGLFHLDSRCLGWNPDFERRFKIGYDLLQKFLFDDEDGPICCERYPELQRWKKDTMTLELYGRPEENLFSDNFARGFAKDFHTTNFSPAVKADFEAWNTLTPPKQVDEDADLDKMNLKEHFGFEGLEHVSQIAAVRLRREMSEAAKPDRPNAAAQSGGGGYTEDTKATPVVV